MRDLVGVFVGIWRVLERFARCDVVVGLCVEVGKMFECLFDGRLKMAVGQAGQGSRKQVDAVF